MASGLDRADGRQGRWMCAALGKGDNDFWVSVSTGEVAEVHLSGAADCPATASSCGGTVMSRNRAIWTHFRRAGTGLRSSRRDGRSRHDKPVNLNYMTLGNTVPHLHTPVLPRYQDDPAPGRADRLGGELRR